MRLLADVRILIEASAYYEWHARWDAKLYKREKQQAAPAG
jgi:hypothetical protein